MKQIFVENIRTTSFSLPASDKYNKKKSFYYIKDNSKLFVYCGRYIPSKFEINSPLLNPHKIKDKENKEEISQAVNSFKKDIWEDIKAFDSNNNILSDRLEFIFNLSNEKRDIHLFCWCSPNPCHCDVIKNLLLALRDEEKILSILPLTEEVPYLENPIPPFVYDKSLDKDSDKDSDKEIKKDLDLKNPLDNPFNKKSYLLVGPNIYIDDEADLVFV
jgi:hypothetical protein